MFRLIGIVIAIAIVLIGVSMASACPITGAALTQAYSQQLQTSCSTQTLVQPEVQVRAYVQPQRVLLLQQPVYVQQQQLLLQTQTYVQPQLQLQTYVQQQRLSFFQQHLTADLTIRQRFVQRPSLDLRLGVRGSHHGR